MDTSTRIWTLRQGYGHFATDLVISPSIWTLRQGFGHFIRINASSNRILSQTESRIRISFQLSSPLPYPASATTINRSFSNYPSIYRVMHHDDKKQRRKN